MKGMSGETCVSSGTPEEQLLTKLTKNPKPNKNKDHERVRRDPCHSDIPEWLQECRENLVDDRVPEHRDSLASSSHVPSLERTPARSADLGKQSVYTHFPKDRNCEICHKSSQWRLWISKQSSICNRGAGLKGSSRIRAKQKLLRKQKRACKSSWSQIGNLKSFTLTIPLNLAKHVKIFPGIIVRQHHTDREQMGLLREQYAEWKKVRLQYCCNQVWMKNGGQIPRGAILVCETSQIFYLMWRLHTKDVLEKLLKDQSCRLIHWLSITLFLRKTSQESIKLERKSYLDCSLDTTRWEIGRVTQWLQTLRSWKRWTHQKSTLRDSMQRK